MEEVKELTTELNRNKRMERTSRRVTEQELISNRNRNYVESR